MTASSSYHNRIIADMLRDDLQMDGTPASALSDIFEREPVPLTAFIADNAYLGNPRLSGIQFDFVHKLEQIYLPETYIAMVEEFGAHWAVGPMKHMLVAEWGKGAGKDSCCRLGVTRAADLLSCLRSPQDYFGFPRTDDIHLLNIAASGDQARRAFFSPMRRLFATNKHLSHMLRDGVVPGEMATTIRLEKNIELISGHSEVDTQEGLNILVGIADEVSAFKTNDELARAGIVAEGRAKKTAEGIVKMLRSSARSRFPTSFKVAQISYPRFKGDAIQQAMYSGEQSIIKAKAIGTESQYYLSGPYSTWDVNPRRDVVREKFQDDYDEDPEMAAAMYECKPSGAVNRFMRNDLAIAHAFSDVIPDPIAVEYFWGLPDKMPLEEGAPPEIRGWQVRFHFHHDLVAMPGSAYCLHGDLAKNGDRAGVAMSHVRTWIETQPNDATDVFERRPIVKNDFTFSFEADLKAVNPDTGEIAAREVQIRWYRQLIWELISREFYVASATFDGWQSLDMMQILLSREIESKLLSLDRKPDGYFALRDVIEDNRLEGYFRPLLIREISSLRKLPNGKIDHPIPGSKDESDALAGSVCGALEMGGDEGSNLEKLKIEDQLSHYAVMANNHSSGLGFGGSLSLGLASRESLTELGFGG